MQRSAISIRPAELRDLAAIRDVLVATWHATYDPIMGVDQVTTITDRWHSIDNLARQLAEATHRPSKRAFLIAENDGVVVATASASQMLDPCLALERLYVLPERQGKRIGDKLLREVLRRFPEASKIRLEVDPENTKAISFYQKYGLRAIASGNTCGGDEDAKLPHLIMEGSLPLTAIRPAADTDAQDLFGLLSLCFAEYPGCFVDPHADLPDLLRPAASFAANGGAFWVVDDERGRVAACCAIDFPAPGMAELHRLYVRPDMRRIGLAQRFLEKAERFAIANGASVMVLWSDTRFETAHRFYKGNGYRQISTPRILNDISNSLEYFFEKQLTP